MIHPQRSAYGPDAHRQFARSRLRPARRLVRVDVARFGKCRYTIGEAGPAGEIDRAKSGRADFKILFAAMRG
ncbi:MAG TPA: hypothetical protein VHZ07_16125 [Bryobacteraceae bacterium]|nr:hypothetical protein [Bryobacteraceae bacterium]